MKQLACMFLAALLLLTLFTGCAKADVPDAPTETTEPAATVLQPRTALSVPDRFTGQWQGVNDTFTVKADAKILIPEDLGRLCTAKVTRRSFTQEDADKLLEIFLKGNPLYKDLGLTKGEYQELIDHYESILRGEIPFQHDGCLDDVPELIERYKEAMKTAPNEGDTALAETNFHPSVSMPDGMEIIDGYGEVDGKTLSCFFSRSQDSRIRDSLEIWEEDCILSAPPLWEKKAWEGTDFPGKDQALQVGNALMEELGLSDVVCNRAVPLTNGNPSEGEDPNAIVGVSLDYVRLVNGLPLTATNFGGTMTEDNAPDDSLWPYEQIQVYVQGDRVVRFHWEDPCEITDIQTDIGELMDFQQIQQVFSKMFFVKNSDQLRINQINGFDTLHDVTIDKVQLTLMRVRPKDNGKEGTIIPVWDFWGTQIARAADVAYEDIVAFEPHYEVQLTINALDGTLVDRQFGY